MADIEFELEKLRKNFYQINYRRMVKVLIFFLLVNLLLVFKLFYDMSNIPEPKYYASSKSGSVTQVYALSDPIYDHQEIKEWLEEALTTTCSFNFVNYNEIFQKNLKYFTETGLDSFKVIFQNPVFLDEIIANKIVISAVTKQSRMVFVKEKVEGVYYTWQVKLPLLLNYQSTAGTSQKLLHVFITITRKSLQDVAISDMRLVKVN